MSSHRQPRRSTTKNPTKIAERRVEQVITQRQAAAATGIPFWTYQRLESGDLLDPGLRHVINTALALRYPGEDLWAAIGKLWEDYWPEQPWLTVERPEELPANRRLRSARTTAGWSQVEVAASLGISERAYRWLESGTTDNPRLVPLARCAILFDVTLHEVCEEQWLQWMVFARHGTTRPGDLD